MSFARSLSVGGYAFYTSEKAIESCMTVSYSINVQPVVAFVGGVQFDVMPSPLASIENRVLAHRT